MPTGEMWEYDPDGDKWTELPAHPGKSRWAPGKRETGRRREEDQEGERETHRERDEWSMIRERDE